VRAGRLSYTVHPMPPARNARTTPAHEPAPQGTNNNCERSRARLTGGTLTAFRPACFNCLASRPRALRRRHISGPRLAAHLSNLLFLRLRQFLSAGNPAVPPHLSCSIHTLSNGMVRCLRSLLQVRIDRTDTYLLIFKTCR